MMPPSVYRPVAIRFPEHTTAALQTATFPPKKESQKGQE
jgi:hypothetical protein